MAIVGNPRADRAASDRTVDTRHSTTTTRPHHSLCYRCGKKHGPVCKLNIHPDTNIHLRDRILPWSWDTATILSHKNDNGHIMMRELKEWHIVITHYPFLCRDIILPILNPWRLWLLSFMQSRVLHLCPHILTPLSCQNARAAYAWHVGVRWQWCGWGWCKWHRHYTHGSDQHQQWLPPMDFTVDRARWETNLNRAPCLHISTKKHDALNTMVNSLLELGFIQPSKETGCHKYTWSVSPTTMGGVSS